jgi:hypothetical protein
MHAMDSSGVGLQTQDAAAAAAASLVAAAAGLLVTNARTFNGVALRKAYSSPSVRPSWTAHVVLAEEIQWEGVHRSLVWRTVYRASC